MPRMDGPVLQTERLTLRPPKAEDFDAWVRFGSDEQTMRFMGGVQPRSVAWRGICTVTGAWSLFGYSMFSVVETATGRWIGRLGPWRPADWPGTEVGWGLCRDVWGQGYATEGAAAAIDWAFDVLGWTDVIHCIDPENLASQGVAKRLGSKRLGSGFMPAPYDVEPVDIWGQTREAWRARKR
jgi:RimJ/RimL family protein N-acetyltransferase